MQLQGWQFRLQRGRPQRPGAAAGLHTRLGCYGVVDHTGNFFHYDGPWDAKHVARNFKRNPAGVGAQAPSQWPFSLNDARNPAHRKAGIYHWTPDITDFTDPVQERNFQMAGLDDLNSENPVVRKALRDSYGYWI